MPRLRQPKPSKGLRLARLVVAGLLMITAPLMTASPPAAAEPTTEGQSVLQIQRGLNELGYSAGPEDGIYGDKTRGAIRAFERDHDMRVTGRPDADLRQRIEAALERARQTAPAESDAAPTEGTGGGEAGAPSENGTEAPGGDRTPDETGQPASGEPSARAPDTADATSADGEAARRRATSGTTLVGSRWRVTDASGSTFTLTFRPDGRLDGPTISGRWRWRRADGDLVIKFDAGPGLSTERRADWPTGDRMQGTARADSGRTWDWQATRLEEAGTGGTSSVLSSEAAAA